MSKGYPLEISEISFFNYYYLYLLLLIWLFYVKHFYEAKSYIKILDNQIKARIIKVNDLPVAPVMKSCSLEYMYSKLTNIDEEEYKESERTVTPFLKKQRGRARKGKMSFFSIPLNSHAESHSNN